MARRLKTLAEVINKSGKAKAYLSPSFCNTDRKPKGLRYITRKGKGRKGYKLVVMQGGSQVFSHDSAETYRCNEEADKWVRENIEGKAQ